MRVADGEGQSLIAYPAQNPGHNDMFYNNTCIMTGNGNYANFDGCEQARSLPIMHDNNVYTPAGTATECGMVSCAAYSLSSQPF